MLQFLVLISLGLLAAVALACVVLWVMYVPRVVHALDQSPLFMADRHPPHTTGEECSVLTSDGYVLSGTYLGTTAEARRGVVAFCHELHGNRWSVAPSLSELLASGFDVFTFDFRNHGQSDHVEGYRPVPWVTQHELADVKAVVDYLLARPDADSEGVGLFGVSRGGSAALCHAGRDRRVCAVVTDGAYPLEALQIHYFRRYMEIYSSLTRLWSKLPDGAINAAIMWGRLILSLRHGYRFVSIESWAARVRQPVLMIHGARDTLVPVAMARFLKARLAGPTKLWIVPRARHNAAVVAAPVEYPRRVCRFFERRLSSEGRELKRRAGRRIRDSLRFRSAEVED